MPDIEVNPSTDFKALPLELIIGQPLKAAIAAQAAAAMATKSFLESMLKDEGAGEKTPIYVEFTTQVAESQGQGKPPQSKDVKVMVPLLSLVPVPHLRIDSIQTHFTYSVSQTISDKTATDIQGTLEFKANGLFSKILGISLCGSISNQKSHESTMNRSGVLDVTVHASEAPMPEGLAKILDILVKSISFTS